MAAIPAVASQLLSLRAHRSAVPEHEYRHRSDHGDDRSGLTLFTLPLMTVERG
jgi:hypothetical protein